MTVSGKAAQIVDCHVHLFDPERFPYSPATHQPQPNDSAPVQDLIAVMDAHEISQAVVVNPTVGYGTTNAVTQAAIAQYPDRLAGIAVVDLDVTPAQLSTLKANGFLGIRLDLLEIDMDSFFVRGSNYLGLIREHAMILQVQTENNLLVPVIDLLKTEAGTMVFDHMGRPDLTRGLKQSGFCALCDLANLDNVFVKLSGPFRFSKTGFPYPDVDRYAHTLVDAYGPERCVWGSDWPFVCMDRRLDYGPALDTLERLIPDKKACQCVLWDTPHRLFGFDGSDNGAAV